MVASERSNTLRGLRAKRPELVKYRDQLEYDIHAFAGGSVGNRIGCGSV